MEQTSALFERQIADCTDAEGRLDIEALTRVYRTSYIEMQRERERTQRVIHIMGEEVEELTRDLESRIAARTLEALELRERFDLALDSISQGILLVGADGVLIDANQVAMDILGLDAGELNSGLTFLDLMARLEAEGEFAATPVEQVALWRTQQIHDQPRLYTRVRPDGRHIEIRTTLLPDGACVRTYTDITELYHNEQALISAEREYRTLFDNAEVGIYRAALDKALIRANPALARLHGFGDETELLAATRTGGVQDWFVRPEEATNLWNRVIHTGRVQDFVSEIRRHKNGEQLWISQTLWLVRGEDGAPICIEGMVTDSTERVMAERQVLELSRNDPLTGLGNRRSFLDRLEEAGLRGMMPSILFLDLDRFKFVNDTLGHASGDLLLKAVTRRLQLLMDDGCELARLGGDEFAILTFEPDHTQIMAMAERLIAGIARPFLICGLRTSVGLSVGIAFGEQAGSGPSSKLLNMADIALYAAKAEGKGKAVAFRAEMAEQSRRRQAVEQALRDALGRDEFALAYQPVVDARTGAVPCREALIRWTSATLGAVSPMEFIPIAEETGLIHALGAWVLRTACSDAQTHFPDARIAVNVSAVQLRSPHFVRLVREALMNTGLGAAALVIEITENVLISDDRLALDVLEELRGMGVGVALDDFGTGYSSMVYLQKFPFDKIKIDKSFVKNALAGNTNGAIIKAIVALAGELGMEMVAEGVETQAEAEFLLNAGCYLHQGYFYARPTGVPECFTTEARIGPAVFPSRDRLEHLVRLAG